MRKKRTVGEQLIDAVSEALESKDTGRIVRSGFDVKKLRTSLKLTQREFSQQYHINLETLRNWEQEKRLPDLTSLAFLTCIARNPQVIQELLNG